MVNLLRVASFFSLSGDSFVSCWPIRFFCDVNNIGVEGVTQLLMDQENFRRETRTAPSLQFIFSVPGGRGARVHAGFQD